MKERWIPPEYFLSGQLLGITFASHVIGYQDIRGIVEACMQTCQKPKSMA